MTEETPHPLTRMATINKPDFWIFIGACVVLYICDKLTTPDLADMSRHIANGNYIVGLAFAGLLLHLVSSIIKNDKTIRVLAIACYVFEIGTVIFLLLRIFNR